MPPLKPLPFRDVKRKLPSLGFHQASQRGSHVKFIKETPDGVRVVIVPMHREIEVGTLKNILRLAGISTEEFIDL
ncbi:MAG: type II toxin-antitoxin system HicA family toxin [Candidatus Omnitrophota bacterium]